MLGRGSYGGSWAEGAASFLLYDGMEDVQYVCVASVVGALLLSSVAPRRVLASYSNDVIMVTVNCAWLRPVVCGLPLGTRVGSLVLAIRSCDNADRLNVFGFLGSTQLAAEVRYGASALSQRFPPFAHAFTRG